MKEIWYQFVIDNPKYWANGFTVNRLKKIKHKIFNNKDIMFDLMDRHGGSYMDPKVMQQDNKYNFDHCIGNFVGNISYIMRIK